MRFEPSVAPADLALRRCSCSFCRRHGAVTVTDPDGHLEIRIVDLNEAVRYRFGAKTADFLLCGRCGVYVAAVLAVASGAVATLNVNTLDDRQAFTAQPREVSYDDESLQQRQRRRAENWTVTSVVVGH